MSFPARHLLVPTATTAVPADDDRCSACSYTFAAHREADPNKRRFGLCQRLSGPIRLASPRATTSSRKPGRKFEGTVYRRPVELGELHIHTCGLRMQECEACSEWFCAAPGHAAHACGGAP